ncbi:uridine diphosphate-N-acetylglucosamine-binding protein YvcK [Deinococcus detaillensis]|uniref:Putative gluconeogenesis factor n=2 Tax=Deinococcus detaillensis TaxID=2592048 RepID=A0A553V161_9DEIO|nr:uridine diphosphate-N-acetylglucosamine-binding protein YvcK [Deinococcus detaillensis]
MGIKRWFALFAVCTFIGALGFLHFTWTGPLHFVATRWILWLNNFTEPEVLPLWVVGSVVMALSLAGAFTAITMLNRSLLRSVGTDPGEAVNVIYSRTTLARGPRVVAVGGGTGLSNVLSGLKAYSSNLTAVVTVSDDGGSSGRLREALDMIAPGDLTDCYAALSDSPVLARLLLHRFARGEGIEGHTFGNLLLATLSEEQGGLGGAMQEIHEVLNVRGAVYPATTQPATLIARLKNGQEVRGESHLADWGGGDGSGVSAGAVGIEEVRLEPPNLPTLSAVTQAIEGAELIVLGPGSLFTSIIPALLVPGIQAAICASSAPLVYVASIMTEPGETDDLTLDDHLRMIERHLGRFPDLVVVNNEAVPSTVQARYRETGAVLIAPHSQDARVRSSLRHSPMLLSGQAHHDPHKLALVLVGLLGNGHSRWHSFQANSLQARSKQG